ncbi:MAG: phytanoyl-CoA dioxygenase family protein [Pseudomonadota bacterium]|nr:phytanoyl-CoA dioxygenase family protein [Pseudomonadota bacterium]
MSGLTAEQISQFRADGFYYPLDALSETEVSQFREGLAMTEEHIGVPLADADGKFRHNLHTLCRWTDDLIRHPAILDVIESLMGPNIILYTCRAFIKPPKSLGITAWHQDSTYFGLRPFDHVTAWVALSDVDSESGPAEFARGSHIRGQLLQESNVVENSVNTAGQMTVEWFDKSDTDCAILKAGQFSLHHTCTLHQSAPNKSNRPRIGLALSYISTRTSNTGSFRMPATLVRGSDEYGNFDLQPRPVVDFGPEETRRHAASHAVFLENFHEQRKRHEAGLAANMA